ncbi:RapZ C-terminal domain-containing protein [Ferruginibacter sp. SUN002]|uniref:RapZ C-terminal domain-containing protein n=1 Tax=Ferruginibacter sp. SUN002 TaxID=2937789 RepID=UPI003D365C62
MQTVINEIKELFEQFSKDEINAVDKLPQSGGDRVYFRITTDKTSYIATFNNNLKENNTFIAFSGHFKKAGSPVPEIYAVNSDKTIYIQQDFGNASLLHQLETIGYKDDVYALYQKSLKALANLQINGDKGLDYNLCITSKEFGKQAIIADLLYFKYYFLDTLKIPYDKEKLIDDFDALSTYLSHVDHKYFMFRDFQSRNIMVKENEIYFIDYQGGMKGALQYDVASLLWQAKAELSDQWKNNLLQYYISCVEEILNKPIDKNRFEAQYNGYVLIRLLQVLGAYGFRGLFERKAHFLISIPLALNNLKHFLANKHVGIVLPEFERLLSIIIEDEVVKRFQPTKATDKTPLIVKINSFSFLKSGYPKDETANGGGFVFDMRGILNPGRIDEYKTQSGLDKGVQDFLEQQTKMPEFLNSIYNIVDIAVEDYINRGFESLMINFGCTGGQHRSVYAAEQVARHLKNKFNVKVQLSHMNKENWRTLL